MYTRDINSDKTRPIPDYGGYVHVLRSGSFPGAGRFFFANTTQNEQTPKWESFTRWCRWWLLGAWSPWMAPHLL